MTTTPITIQVELAPVAQGKYNSLRSILPSDVSTPSEIQAYIKELHEGGTDISLILPEFSLAYEVTRAIEKMRNGNMDRLNERSYVVDIEGKAVRFLMRGPVQIVFSVHILDAAGHDLLDAQQDIDNLVAHVTIHDIVQAIGSTPTAKYTS